MENHHRCHMLRRGENLWMALVAPPRPPPTSVKWIWSIWMTTSLVALQAVPAFRRRLLNQLTRSMWTAWQRIKTHLICVSWISPSYDTVTNWIFHPEPFNIAVQQASTSEDCSKRLLGATPLSTTAVKHSTLEYVPNSDLHKEEWFHGLISRKESESLVIRDGDFLVRESQGSTGQYVLTGMQDGNRKHLLLVDPEGVVSGQSIKLHSIANSICIPFR